ncbi:F0F1 ATP synthase subunit delta [Paenibacillus sp. MBLB4367]|uniref:F0F1 ATP synthase subunit delta n=1 Tax=Paenibacillus sp. MBLB4367 TaxID=3384767 RepID=UPI0039080967
MSSGSIVAKRYARALFEVAREQNQIAQVEEELRSVLAVIRDNPDFGKLLQHPNIASAAKIDMVKEIFGGQLSDTVFNTLCLLLERRREDSLSFVLDAYIAIANETLGQANAVVTSPYALSDKEKEEITAQFGKLVGKKIRIENVIDASLIGGVQVQIGDRLYDGSLSGKLTRLQNSFSKAQ